VLVVRNAVVGPFAENTFLVGDSERREAILIDPGGELDRVLAMREPGGFEIRRVFLTHGHIDHVAGCAEACRRTGATSQVHRADALWLESALQQAAMFGFEEAREAPTADHFHDDGETLTVGEHVGRVLHTPGHSGGSCCLVFEKARTVFSGGAFSGSPSLVLKMRGPPTNGCGPGGSAFGALARFASAPPASPTSNYIITTPMMFWPASTWSVSPVTFRPRSEHR
jgi:glyoxylase-like metal-dependent hydrolase (beta-lactamase superfamily II)